MDMFGRRRKRVPADGPFYQQRGWINSAFFLGFVVVMSLVALVTDTGRTGGADTAAGGPKPLSGLSGPLSPGDPQQLRSGPEGRPGNCHTEDEDVAESTSAPANVRWQERFAIMVPTSPSAGPLHTDGATWWCFARTPTGAMLAAHIIPVQLSGDAWRVVAEQQIVPGEMRDRFVSEKATADSKDPAERALGRFVGFSVASYSDDSANVRLLLTNPLGGYLSTSVSVRWRDGDWKVALQDDGSLYSIVKRAKPDGFVMWGD